MISVGGSVALGAIYVLGCIAALYLLYKAYEYCSVEPLLTNEVLNDTMVSQIMNDSSRENNPYEFRNVCPDALVDLREKLLSAKDGNQIIVEYYDTKRLQTSVFVVNGDAPNLTTQLGFVFECIKDVPGEFAVHMNCLDDTNDKGLSDTIKQCIRGSVEEGNPSSQQGEQSGEDLSIEFFGGLNVDITEANGCSKGSVHYFTQNRFEFTDLVYTSTKGVGKVRTYLVKRPYFTEEDRTSFISSQIKNPALMRKRKRPTPNSRGKTLRFKGGKKNHQDRNIVGCNGAGKLLYPQKGFERYSRIKNNLNESDGHRRAGLFRKIVERRPEVDGVFEASEPTKSTLKDGSLFYKRANFINSDPYGEEPDLLHIGEPVQWKKAVGVDGEVEYEQGKVLGFVYYHTTPTGSAGWLKKTLGQKNEQSNRQITHIEGLRNPPKVGMDQGCVYYNVAEKV